MHSAVGAELAAGILCLSHALAIAQTCSTRGDFNDAHFHLTNYVQEGITPAQLLQLMGNRVPRSTLFGIPLHQQWSYRLTGKFAPRYYLESDAHLYYYSFTDAVIATSYLALPPERRARLDPMITGFNPADMYAAEHVRRVLTTFPGVFTGIGEFTIHKEFVSSKIAGEAGSLTDPALDKLLDFAGEVGLVAIMHNDIVMPFTRRENERSYFDQMKQELRLHPNTTIIWAHTGLGRVVQPPSQHIEFLEEILSDPGLSHVHFDISWDEAGKYIVRDERATETWANLISRYPSRFLMGTDWVAPETAEKYYSLYEMYQPLWSQLMPEVSADVRLCNYERLFDAARVRVRAWERDNVPKHSGEFQR
jgi:hypothetical protein